MGTVSCSVMIMQIDVSTLNLIDTFGYCENWNGLFPNSIRYRITLCL
jgi:hypothetical protein